MHGTNKLVSDVSRETIAFTVIQLSVDIRTLRATDKLNSYKCTVIGRISRYWEYLGIS